MSVPSNDSSALRTLSGVALVASDVLVPPAMDATDTPKRRKSATVT